MGLLFVACASLFLWYPWFILAGVAFALASFAARSWLIPPCE